MSRVGIVRGLLSAPEIATALPDGASTGTVQVTTPGGILSSGVVLQVKPYISRLRSDSSRVSWFDVSHLEPSTRKGRNRQAGMNQTSQAGAPSGQGRAAQSMPPNRSASFNYRLPPFSSTNIAPLFNTFSGAIPLRQIPMQNSGIGRWV